MTEECAGQVVRADLVELDDVHSAVSDVRSVLVERFNADTIVNVRIEIEEVGHHERR